MDLRFTLHRGKQGFSEVVDAWSELCRSLNSQQFYQWPAWYRSYMDSLSKDPETIFFVAVHRQQELMALIPLELIRRRVYGVNLRVIQFPSHQHMALYDCLLSPEVERGFLQQLVSFIRQQKRLKWDLMFFHRVPEDSYTNRMFKHGNVAGAYSQCFYERFFIDCNSDLEAALKHIPSRFRRNLRRLERKAEKLGELSLDIRYAGEDGFNDGYRDLLEIEGDGWKQRANTAILCDQKQVAFYERLASYFSSPFRCHVNRLLLDGKGIAAQFGIDNGVTISLLKIGYLEEYKNAGPGNVLLLKLLKEQYQTGQVKTIDIGTAPEWAQKWKSRSIGVYRHFVFNRTPKGMLVKHSYLLAERLKDFQGKREIELNK